MLGIDSAARNWKMVKSLKTGQRYNTGTIKCNNQVLIYGTIMHQNSGCRQAKLSSSRKIWSENYFQGSKMDVFCNDIIDSLGAP